MLTTAQPAILRAITEGPVSLERFLGCHDEDLHAEWVDGKVIVMSPVSRRHQDLADFLTICVRLFVEAHRLGKALSAPFSMHLDVVPSVREPDLLFVATEHLDRFTDSYLDGPADLVVEVVSPESLGRDRGDKFAEYEAAGIPEYWLVDPIRQQAEFHTLENERYRPVPLVEGIFHSTALPGFWLRVDWLWKDPMPNVTSALREMNLL